MAHAQHAGSERSSHAPPSTAPAAPDPYDLTTAAPAARPSFVTHRPTSRAVPAATATDAAVPGSRPAPLPHGPHAPRHFHPLPVIGHAPAFYEKHIQQADASGDRHARAAHKVGLHITTALGPALAWDEKLKRFIHCLEHYCVAPDDADESLQSFYQKLGDLVRRHAGQEAIHLSRKQHEEYTRRLKAGEPRAKIEDDADLFFVRLLGHNGRPDWCSREAWATVVAWRDQWV